MKKASRPLSKTPRSPANSRKVHFSIAMREKISEDWISTRKKFKKRLKKKLNKKKE